MMVDFDRVFNPTVEQQLEDLNTALRIHNEAIKKKWCSTCKHWTAPPRFLPGFVENHGDCTCNHVVDATPNCYDYEFNKEAENKEELEIKNRIAKLKGLQGEKHD